MSLKNPLSRAMAAAALVIAVSAPASSGATEVLPCEGRNWGVRVSGGAEGGYLGEIFAWLKDESWYIYREDLSKYRLDRAKKELSIEQKRLKHFKHVLKINAKGAKGTLYIDGKDYPVKCYWGPPGGIKK